MKLPDDVAHANPHPPHGRDRVFLIFDDLAAARRSATDSLFALLSISA